MNRMPIVAVFLTLVTAPAGRAAQPEPLQYYQEMARPESSAEEILAVTLDSDIYAVTQNGFADLRVVDSQGAEVPYRLEKEI